MIKATLFRQFSSQKEYKTITVYAVSDIQSYCTNGWRCINYQTVNY